MIYSDPNGILGGNFASGRASNSNASPLEKFASQASFSERERRSHLDKQAQYETVVSRFVKSQLLFVVEKPTYV